jgi:hypothetical protein
VAGRFQQSENDFHDSEEREKKWRAHNVTFLSSAFTTYEYADEYSQSQIVIHQTMDPYASVGLRTFGARLLSSVRRQVKSLESIVERLELIEEATTGVADGEALLQDKSKVFVVHGHDEGALQAVARFLEAIGLRG